MNSSTEARRSNPPGRAYWRVAAAVAAVFALLLATPASSFAGEPTDRVRGAIDRVLEILKKKDLQAKERRMERRTLLREEISKAFDFDEMAKRSLGPAWRQRTPEERKEYVGLFRQVLENSYLGKVEAYQGEKIRYGKESVEEGRFATVETLIVTGKGQEIPLNYRMVKGKADWRVYDVIIEEISLVNNYRSQFGGILQRSSFQDLLARLRDMVKSSDSGPAGRK
ncbi:MAG: ABC transporter substrate-binding protein [Deltaproteobacteria bacterium]|nr:ABC transporter substrate-binding protein [Deltaproteobacteria bacterium]